MKTNIYSRDELFSATPLLKKTSMQMAAIHNLRQNTDSQQNRGVR